MAETTVGQPTAAETNGARDVIEVENPATGEIVGTVPKMTPERGGARSWPVLAPRSRAGRRSASRAVPVSCGAPRSGCSTTRTA